MRSWLLVRDEVSATLDAVDPARMNAAAAVFADRNRRWFTSGQGRSGIVARMIAMRLMHLGFDVHVVGETTAPSIGARDGLLMLSSSGETPVSVHLARLAAEAGARILAVTTRPDSSLAAMANVVVPVPIPASKQFGGSLFEQAALMLLDALILDLTSDDPHAHDLMQRRHTNLE
jgi:6-phospho-3-hexuloisomerase